MSGLSDLIFYHTGCFLPFCTYCTGRSGLFPQIPTMHVAEPYGVVFKV